MSIMDLDKMTPAGIVAQYVIELFGSGHFLSRDDYARLEKWLTISQSADDLLIVLEDILPPRIEKSRAKGKKVFSLSSIHRSVEKKLNERISLLGGASHGIDQFEQP